MWIPSPNGTQIPRRTFEDDHFNSVQKNKKKEATLTINIKTREISTDLYVFFLYISRNIN